MEESNNTYREEKELLHKQLELLAEQSRGADCRELAEISCSMCEIYRLLKDS